MFTYLQVMVSHCESVGRVYLQSCRRAADLELLLDQLDDVYSYNSKSDDLVCRSASALSVSDAVVVRVDNVWKRGTVLRVDGESISARLVDYGDICHVTVDNVRLVNSQDVVSIVPFAFECQLFGISEHQINGKYSLYCLLSILCLCSQLELVCRCCTYVVLVHRTDLETVEQFCDVSSCH